MASFDVVSEVDIQEVDNAVNQAQKEISSRFDFKGAKVSMELDKTKMEVKLSADSDLRLDALRDILCGKLFKRGIDLGALEIGKHEQAGGMILRQIVKLKQGLEQKTAKDLIKSIKDSKLKVDATIQGTQLRVTAKKIDDLQATIGLLKEKASELRLPLQFVNMRS